MTLADEKHSRSNDTDTLRPSIVQNSWQAVTVRHRDFEGIWTHV